MGWRALSQRAGASAHGTIPPLRGTRDEGLGRWRSVAEGAVRAHAVVVTPPALVQDLGLGQAVEDLAVEQFVAQLAIEALAVDVLPGVALRDVDGLGADRGDPFAQSDCDELQTVVRPNIGRRAAQDHLIGQGLKHVGGVELPFHSDGQRLMRELVDQTQHPELLSIMGPILDEVVGPDVVGPLGAQAHARAVVQPQPHPNAPGSAPR